MKRCSKFAVLAVGTERLMIIGELQKFNVNETSAHAKPDPSVE